MSWGADTEPGTHSFTPAQSLIISILISVPLLPLHGFWKSDKSGSHPHFIA